MSDPVATRARFADSLRDLMDSAGISGAELGRRLGTNKTSVSRWRSGEDLPRPQFVVEMADILGVDRMLLLQLAGYMQPEGDSAEIDPRRASLMQVVRDEIAEEDLGIVERILGTFRVRPTRRAKTHPKTSAKTRERDQSTGSDDADSSNEGPLTLFYDHPRATLALQPAGT